MTFTRTVFSDDENLKAKEQRHLNHLTQILIASWYDLLPRDDDRAVTNPSMEVMKTGYRRIGDEETRQQMLNIICPPDLPESERLGFLLKIWNKVFSENPCKLETEEKYAIYRTALFMEDELEKPILASYDTKSKKKFRKSLSPYAVTDPDLKAALEKYGIKEEKEEHFEDFPLALPNHIYQRHGIGFTKDFEHEFASPFLAEVSHPYSPVLMIADVWEFGVIVRMQPDGPALKDLYV